MYEKFTDRARKVMQLAAREARWFGLDYIGTEHILLGLLAERSNVAAVVLKNFDIDYARARAALSDVVRTREPMDSGQETNATPAKTPPALKAIELAGQEAGRLNHHFIGPEHLLLGLIRANGCAASNLLGALGASAEQVRSAVFELLGQLDMTQQFAGGPITNPRMNQPDVFALVQAERAYQDAKWGAIAEHPHEVGAWLLVMQGKLNGAIAKWQGTPNDLPALGELVKAVAVGVACLEQHGGGLFMKLLGDLEFTRTNCGYMSPDKRGQCYFPVLEAIRDRMKEAAPDAAPEAR